MIDNSLQIARLIDLAEHNDDTFWYTELIDRTQSKGNNRIRLYGTYFHSNGLDLLSVMPQIIGMCEYLGIRAYTRLSPRSYKAVGKAHAELVLQAALSGNYKHQRHIYASAMGRTALHACKLWLYDVDEVNTDSALLREQLHSDGYLVAVIPSKAGQHFIVKPHDVRADLVVPGIQVHKDNPTNLYIPSSLRGKYE